MDLVPNITQKLKKFDKSSNYNTIILVYGNKIQENAFDTKIKYINSNKGNLFDLIPIINTLFLDNLIDFELLREQYINVEDMTLKSTFNNKTKIKTKEYFQNKLSNYQIFNFGNEHKYDILVKYKKNKKISLIKYNNTQYFHNLELFHSLRWILIEDIYIKIKFNKSFFTVSLELDLGKTQISTQKLKNISEILEKFKILLDYINIV